MPDADRLSDAERDELLAVMSPAQWLALARACRRVQAGSGYGQVSVEFRRGLPRHVETVISEEMPAPRGAAAPSAAPAVAKGTGPLVAGHV